MTHKTCRGPQALCLGSYRDGLKAQEQARIAKEQAKEAADAAEQARAASKVADSSVKEAQHNVSKAIQHRKLFIQRQSATVRLNYAIPTGHVSAGLSLAGLHWCFWLAIPMLIIGFIFSIFKKKVNT